MDAGFFKTDFLNVQSIHLFSSVYALMTLKTMVNVCLQVGKAATETVFSDPKCSFEAYLLWEVYGLCCLVTTLPTLGSRRVLWAYMRIDNLFSRPTEGSVVMQSARLYFTWNQFILTQCYGQALKQFFVTLHWEHPHMFSYQMKGRQCCLRREFSLQCL